MTRIAGRMADRLLTMFVPTATAAAASTFCERCGGGTHLRLCSWVWQSSGGYVKVCSGCDSC